MIYYDLLREKIYSILIKMELLFAMKKSMEIVLYRKLKKFNLLLKKLWYNTQNYGTLHKTMLLYRKLRNVDLIL